MDSGGSSNEEELRQQKFEEEDLTFETDEVVLTNQLIRQKSQSSSNPRQGAKQRTSIQAVQLQQQRIRSCEFPEDQAG